MTSHAGVTSHKSEQEERRKPIPECLGTRDVDLGAAAIRTILEADSSHVGPLASGAPRAG